MKEDIIIEKKRKVELIHEKVATLFTQKKTPGEMQREFRNKYAQYKEMYASLETMKALTSKENAKESLLKQQALVLETWAEFELDIVERLSHLSQ